jgi:hypothetical protein
MLYRISESGNASPSRRRPGAGSMVTPGPPGRGLSGGRRGPGSHAVTSQCPARAASNLKFWHSDWQLNLKTEFGRRPRRPRRPIGPPARLRLQVGGPAGRSRRRAGPPSGSTFGPFSSLGLGLGPYGHGGGRRGGRRMSAPLTGRRPAAAFMMIFQLSLTGRLV